MIWIGAIFLIKRQSEKRIKLGFALIFANLPFARILTASFASGDEVFGLSKLMDYNTAWIVGLTSIVLIVAYPLYVAYQSIENKRRIGWFLLFFLAPTFIDLLLILGVLNTLLANGILAKYWILGSPMIVTIWTISVGMALFFFWKYLYEQDHSQLSNPA